MTAEPGGARRLRTLLRLACSVALLALLAARVEWRPVGALLARVRPPQALAALGLFVAAQAISAAKWRSIARHLDCARPLATHLRLYFGAMFLSLFLPSLVAGDLYRAARLGDGWRPSRRAFGSVFLERLTGLWALLLVAALGGAVARGWRLGWAGVALLALLPLGVRRWRRLAPATPPVLLASIAVQLLYVAVHATVAAALGLSLSWRVWLWIAPTVGLVASLPVSLGGLGPREWGYVALLKAVGVGSVEAVAFACGWLVLVTGVSLAGGVALLFQGGRLGLGEGHEGIPVEGDEKGGR